MMLKFHDLESEQVVIAAILLSESKLITCINEITSRIFYNKFLRALYSIIIETYKKHSAIIVPSVLKKLLDKDKVTVETRRKFVYLTNKLLTKKITDIEFKLALESVKENYLKRKLIDTSSYILDNIEIKNTKNVYDIIEDSLIDAKLLINNQSITKEGDIKDIEERLKIYDEIRKNPDKYIGVLSGFPELDNLTAGFQKGEYVLIIGGQGSGKSMLMLNFGYNAWMEGKNVVYFSLEMPKLQIERRFDARATAIEYYKIKTQKMSDEEHKNFKLNLNKTFTNRDNIFYIVDIPKNCSPFLISSKMKQLSRKFKIDLIIIDYLGLLDMRTKNSKDMWVNALNCSNELKSIARTFDVPVITASQITTEALKKNYQKEYKLSDVALTRRLSDAADIVLGFKSDMLIREGLVNMIKYRDGTGPAFRVYIDFDRCLIAPIKDNDENK